MTPEIKICGLTNLDDALLALKLGADYLGFVLYSRSPRYIDAARLKSICDKLPATAKKVGVFVNSDKDFVIKTAVECRLHAVQFHGDENIDKMMPFPVNVWKAVRIESGCPELPADAPLAERIVLDSSVDGLYGGTGRQIDLTTASQISSRYKIMLAGGLTPENVKDAITAVKPLGVDVSSGVETRPGIKDQAKVSAFIKAARS